MLEFIVKKAFWYFYDVKDGMIIGKFRSSTSFHLRNRSTHIERESPSELVLAAAVQYEFFSKSRTERNGFGIDSIGQNKYAIHK